MTDHREPSKWQRPSTAAAGGWASGEDRKSDGEEDEELIGAARDLNDEEFVDEGRERAREIPLRSRRARIMLQSKIQ